MGLPFRKTVKFLFMRGVELSAILLLLVFLPNIPPYCSFNESFKVKQALPYEGKLAFNERLKGIERWQADEVNGPESIEVYKDDIYVSVRGGDVVKLVGGEQLRHVVKLGKECKHDYEERTCGRPLGMRFGNDGSLYVADPYYGIFKVNVQTGEKVLLISPDEVVGGRKSKLFNDVTVASNGDLYWTDSSTDFYLEDGLYTFLGDPTGRLVHYNAKTKVNTVLLDHLHFANGVALSKDEDFIVVAVSARSSLERYYLKGPKAGTSDTFIDGLPGLPDNIRSDGRGGFIVPMVMTRDSENPHLGQVTGPFPKLRKLAARLMALFELGFGLVEKYYPNEVTKMALHFVGNFQSANFLLDNGRSTILHVSGDGVILDSLHTKTHAYFISQVTVYKNVLLFGSPFNTFIGRLPLSSAGWTSFAEAPKVTEAPKTTTPPTTQPPTTTPPPTKPPTTTPPPTKPITTTPPPTKPPATTPPPTKPPTTTAPPTTTPPPTTTAPPTKPPTTKPPTTTAPPTQPPTTTKPPTTTPPPTQPPTTPSPTQPTTTLPTNVPPTTTPPPTKSPTTTIPPTQPPKPQTPPPKPQTPPPQKQAPPATTQQQAPPPAQAQPTKEAPKPAPSQKP